MERELGPTLLEGETIHSGISIERNLVSEGGWRVVATVPVQAGETLIRTYGVVLPDDNPTLEQAVCAVLGGAKEDPVHVAVQHRLSLLYPRSADDCMLELRERVAIARSEDVEGGVGEMDDDEVCFQCRTILMSESSSSGRIDCIRTHPHTHTYLHTCPATYPRFPRTYTIALAQPSLAHII